jgi:cell division ATPase FtsA
MDKNIYNVFVNLSTTKISVATFKDSRNHSISFKEYNCAIDFNDDEFNHQAIKKTIEELTFETEKITDSFLNDIYLMIDLPGLKKISLSLMKDHEGNKIEIKDIQYLVQDARQQILSFNNDKEIIHIIIKSYNLDNIRYKNLPKEINCRKFSLDIEFICLPKTLISKLDDLFNNNTISIKKIISTEYVKNFYNIAIDQNICETGYKLVAGLNKQEVVIIPKKVQIKGFFERFFYLFK